VLAYLYVAPEIWLSFLKTAVFISDSTFAFDQNCCLWQQLLKTQAHTVKLQTESVCLYPTYSVLYTHFVPWCIIQGETVGNFIFKEVSEETQMNSLSVVMSVATITLASNGFLIQPSVTVSACEGCFLKVKFQRRNVTSSTHFHIVPNSCINAQSMF
jgi:hypothetical protein